MRSQRKARFPHSRTAVAALVVSASILAAITPAGAITPSLRITVDKNAVSQLELRQTTLAGMYKTLRISQANAGKGIKVGVIDSGIAVYPKGSNMKTNACFTDQGYPKTRQMGDTRFTNNKVIAARLFFHEPIQVAPGIVLGGTNDASAVAPHGSHVAGTIGCNYNTKAYIQGGRVGSISGIAPKVQFGSYVVFPGEGGSPNPDHIAAAIDAAVNDGMHIINMSLGGPADADDTRVNDAIARAYARGVLVIVAAGNEGPDQGTIGTPGNSPDVVTVGSVDGGRELMTTLNVNGRSFRGPVGNIGVSVLPVTGKLVIAGSTGSLVKACTADEIGPEVVGKVAVIERGDCYFVTKLGLLRKAGALGVVVVSQPGNEAGGLSSPFDVNLNIAGIVVSSTDGEAIVAAARSGQNASFATPTLVPGRNMTQVSDFSSAGPAQINGLIKPDIVAPGANLISAASSASVFDTCATTGTCFMLMSGTSMATPYVAGIAAVLRQARPTWSVAMLRSALIHTASQTSVLGASANDPLRRGVGLVNPARAADMTFGIGITSLVVAGTSTTTVPLINPTTKAITVKVTSDRGWLSTPTSVTIPARGQYDLPISVAGGPAGEVSDISVSDGKVLLRFLARSQG